MQTKKTAGICFNDKGGMGNWEHILKENAIQRYMWGKPWQK